MSSLMLIAAIAEAPDAAEPTAFGLNPGAWVAIAVLIVFALLAWKKVHHAVGKALDSKIALIRDQLAEAEALIERRTRMAEDKIAAEERSAVEQLRASAADAAAKAAARLIAERHDA